MLPLICSDIFMSIYALVRITDSTCNQSTVDSTSPCMHACICVHDTYSWISRYMLLKVHIHNILKSRYTGVNFPVLTTPALTPAVFWEQVRVHLRSCRPHLQTDWKALSRQVFQAVEWCKAWSQRRALSQLPERIYCWVRQSLEPWVSCIRPCTCSIIHLKH